MTSLTARLRELNPFNIFYKSEQQKAKEKRIARLETVNSMMSKRVERHRINLVEHTERLSDTVSEALKDYDEFRGKE